MKFVVAFTLAALAGCGDAARPEVPRCIHMCPPTGLEIGGLAVVAPQGITTLRTQDVVSFTVLPLEGAVSLVQAAPPKIVLRGEHVGDDLLRLLDPQTGHTSETPIRVEAVDKIGLSWTDPNLREDADQYQHPPWVALAGEPL